jgi:spore coat polysaccharide biosynthesis protein SpsF
MVNKTILITQARTGSTRLPGKVLKEINGKSLLQIHLERLKKCKSVSEIIVATTTNSEDQVIYDKAIEWGLPLQEVLSQMF